MMARAMNLLGGAIILLLLFSSCVTQKRCYDKFPPKESIQTIVKDSIIYRDRIIRDTIKGDTIIETITLERIKEKPVIIQSKDNKVKARLYLDSLQMLKVELIQKDTIIDRLIENAEIEKSKSIERTITKVHEVKYIPGFYKFTLWYFIITMVIIIIILILKIINPLRI